ncbi:MAG: aquaporin [Acidimicrobiales bacterium]
MSGAHLNPTVSIAFSLRGDFPGRRVPGNVVVQLVGAVVAALSLPSLIHVSALYGSKVAIHLPGHLRPAIQP